MNFLVVGLGGFLGAVSRYGVYLLLGTGGGFPYATLIVNVLGCAAIGFLYELTAKSEALSATSYLLLTTGFLGAFTTFSAFGLETVSFLKNSNYLFATVNILANVVLGLLAVMLPKLIL